MATGSAALRDEASATAGHIRPYCPCIRLLNNGVLHRVPLFFERCFRRVTAIHDVPLYLDGLDKAMP